MMDCHFRRDIMAGIWVRSQDKKILGCYDVINVDYRKGKENQVIAGSINCNEDGVIVGKYVTEERALQVLDEIQKCIIHQGLYMFHDNAMNLSADDFVYEMPAE
jgi:hypothetical protein